MMNKEICLTALSKLRRLEYEENQCDEYSTVINELIYEHFHNPPLKFEELKEGMWVWDNKRKEWCVLGSFWKDALNRYYVGGLSDSPWEQNRFYRKQVEE